MSFLAAVVTTALPVIAGWSATRGWWLGRVLVAALLGFCAMGIGGLLGAVLGNDLFLVGAGLGLVALATLGRLRAVNLERPGRPGRAVVGLLVAVGAVLLLLSVFRAIPTGDAWAIWSLKARAIYESGGIGGPVFTSRAYVFSHQDYPCLLPTIQAIAFKVQGTASLTWPTQWQVAWLWASASVGLVLALPEDAFAQLAGAALLLCPEVLNTSVTGMADAPSALLLLCGAAWLLSPRWQVKWPAFLLLASAALTKNEGTVEALIVVTAALVLRSSKPPRHLWMATVATLAAAAFWAVYDGIRGVSNDEINAHTLASVTFSTVTTRTGQIFSAMAEHMADPRLWGIVVPLIIACLVWRRATWSLTAAGLAALAVLFCRYLLSPYQLAWDMRYSIDRVLMAPLGLLLLGSVLYPMGTRVAASSDEQQRERHPAVGSA